jgi:hypothetical protein
MDPPVVVEDQRAQTEKGLAGRVAIEVDAKPDLDRIAAARAAAAHGDVAYAEILPGQIRRVVGVLLIVLVQLLVVT